MTLALNNPGKLICQKTKQLKPKELYGFTLLTAIVIIITDKLYTHKPESDPENETLKILWDFYIQTEHLISARRPTYWLSTKKVNLQIVDFVVPTDYRVKLKESEKGNENLDLARELKKTMDHGDDGDINCNWCARVLNMTIVIGALVY